ncbi:MAG: lytic murein transglycosylase [Vicinamibacteraceae bacterium]
MRRAAARATRIGRAFCTAAAPAIVLGLALARPAVAQGVPPAATPANTAPVPASPTPTSAEAAAATPTTPTPTPSPHDPAFAAWLDALRGDATAAGIRPATIDAAFATIVAQPVVLERDRSQAEFTLTLGQYVSRRLTPALLRLSKQHAERQRALLARVEKAHQVPRSILVAVWGLESNFGKFAGVRPTVPVLATLAYDGRRAALFRGELLNALRILDRGDIELERLKGSWAGAMGQPQFLPSSYLKFAQDFDGDGRRDIWTSLPDVFASIAAYMASNGWANGESWGRRVKLPADFDARLGSRAPLRSEGCRAVRQLTEPMLLNEWRALGVRTAKGAVLPKASMAASLLRVDQETFLVYRNYETLLTYNCAHSYAIAVGLLSDRLEGRVESWPAAKKAAKPARTAKRPVGRSRTRRR